MTIKHEVKVLNVYGNGKYTFQDQDGKNYAVSIDPSLFVLKAGDSLVLSANYAVFGGLSNISIVKP